MHSVFWLVIRSEGMAKHTDLQILNNLITGLFSAWSCIRHEFRREHQWGPAQGLWSQSRECCAGGEQGRLVKPKPLDSNGSQTISSQWLPGGCLVRISLLQVPPWEKLTENWKQKGRMHYILKGFNNKEAAFLMDLQNNFAQLCTWETTLFIL